MQRETAQSEPAPCVAGCGFFGRSATDGMCSKCFREKTGREPPAALPSSTVAAAASTTVASALNATSGSSSAGSTSQGTRLNGGASLTASFSSNAPFFQAASGVASPATSLGSTTVANLTSSAVVTPEPKKVKTQADRTRCLTCSKKVGLTGIECRCGFVYCGQHRYAEQHACTFDHKSFGRENIAKANERVVAQSLEDKL